MFVKSTRHAACHTCELLCAMEKQLIDFQRRCEEENDHDLTHAQLVVTSDNDHFSSQA